MENKNSSKSNNSSSIMENNVELKRQWISKIIKMQQNGEDFNSPQNSDGWTILMVATKEADDNIMKLILNVRDARKNRLVNINAQDKNGITALAIAAKTNDEKKIILLLKNEADLNLVRDKVSKKVYKKLRDLYQQVQNASKEFIMSVLVRDVEKIKMMLESYPVNINAKIRITIGPDSSECVALVRAASDGDEEIVELLLKDPNIDVNKQGECGFTALRCAALRGSIKVVKMLLNHPNIDVNIQDDEGTTALMCAAKNGDIEIFKLLLNQPNIDINVQSNNGTNALMYATEDVHKEIVKLLLDHPKIEVNKQDCQGCTALISVVVDVMETINHKEIIKLFLNHPKTDVNIKDENNCTAFMYAVRKESKELIKLLLKHPKVDVNTTWIYGYTPLMIAVEDGEIEVVKLLLKHPKIDINKQKTTYGHSALITAVAKSRIEILKLLLMEPKIDVNLQDSDGFTALIWAALTSQKEAFELLLKHPKIRMDIQPYNGFALMHAVAFIGNTEIMKLLISLSKEYSFLNVNSVNRYGDNVLLYAERGGSMEMFKLLLDQPDIDVNKGDIAGRTVLMCSSLCDKKEEVELLLKHPKIDINKHTEKSSALIEAVIKGHEKIVKILLEHGADVNLRYLGGFTALITAVESGYPKIVELLLNQPNIDINAENDAGETALICAEKKYKNRIARLIRSKLELQNEQVESVQEEIQHVPIEKIDERFLKAVSRGDINEMDLLIEEKNDDGKILVNFNARNGDGNTALIIASENGNLEVVRWLISYMEDGKDFKSTEGSISLIKAAKKGHFDVVEELLNQKINVNSTDATKRTALHYATENGHLRVVKLLIKKGAKISTKDKYDKTAMDIVLGKINKYRNDKNRKDKASEHSCYEDIKNALESQNKSSNLPESFDDQLGIKDVALNEWEVVTTEKYDKILKSWEKNDPNTYRKIQLLKEMIEVDPFRGLGRVERLSGDLEGLYSRKIDKSNRLVYEVDGEKVFLLTCKGHYQQEKRKTTNRSRTNSKK